MSTSGDTGAGRTDGQGNQTDPGWQQTTGGPRGTGTEVGGIPGDTAEAVGHAIDGAGGTSTDTGARSGIETGAEVQGQGLQMPGTPGVPTTAATRTEQTEEEEI